MDDEFDEHNADDFEIIEDVELRLCNSDDEKDKKCDSNDEESLTDMYKNVMDL